MVVVVVVVVVVIVVVVVVVVVVVIVVVVVVVIVVVIVVVFFIPIRAISNAANAASSSRALNTEIAAQHGEQGQQAYLKCLCIEKKKEIILDEVVSMFEEKKNCFKRGLH